MSRSIFLVLAFLVVYISSCTWEQYRNADKCVKDIEMNTPSSPKYAKLCDSTIACLKTIDCTVPRHRIATFKERCEYSNFFNNDFKECREILDKQGSDSVKDWLYVVDNFWADKTWCDRFINVLVNIESDVGRYCSEDLMFLFRVQSYNVEISDICLGKS